MSSLVLFVNSFLSYLLVFAIFVGLIVVAVLVGVQVRKNKDLKEAGVDATVNDSEQ